MRNDGCSCLVLGGGGFLGTNLCRRLLADGHRVRAFGHGGRFPQALTGVDWCDGDFSNDRQLANAVESSEFVFHLIHSTTPYSANLNMVRDALANVVPSISLLDISRKFGVKRVIFLSSGGTVYGRPKQIPTDENAPTNPITAYGVSKLSIEKYLALYEYLHGLEYRVLRVANPFGPYQLPTKRQGVIAELISRAMSNEHIEVWGDGSVVRDFIYVDDVVDALVASAFDTGEDRIFNVGSGTGRSIRDIIATIESQTNTKFDVRWGNSRPVDVPVSILAINRAKDQLAWAPRTEFSSGIEKTISWWKDNGAQISQALKIQN